MTYRFASILFAIFAVFIVGCASESPSDDGAVSTTNFVQDEDATADSSSEPKTPPPESSGHHHDAPHGGALIELGDHVASIEFVFESASGTLTAYVLDAHAEDPVRLTGGALFVEIELDGNEEYIPLELRGVASSLTGESETNTSQFRGTERALRGLTTFGGTIPSIAVRGAVFNEVAFRYP